jgi:hypothetical protein
VFGTKFWEQIASGVAQKWTERLFSPALLFWAGGLLAYVVARGWSLVTAEGWTQIVALVQGLETPLQIGFAAGGLVVVAGSAAVVESIQQSALRFLEGYWPCLLGPIGRYRVKRISKRLARLRTAWDALAARYGDLTPEEKATYASLDAKLATYPSQERLLPTQLGNRLRAAEDYPWRHYGLATGVLWPRLWGVMPENAQKEIVNARERLDAAVRLILWSLLFLLWSFWAWYWVIPLAVLGMAWGYWQALNAAGLYGELLRSAFDLYRFVLYEALRWPLPSNPASEHQIGRQLTDYLWRGSDGKTPSFTPYHTN